MNKLTKIKQKQIDKIAKLYNSNQFLKAKKLTLKLLDLYPRDTRVLSLLGAIYNSLEEKNLAKKYFLNVLEIDKNDYSAYNNLGLIDFQKYDFKNSKTMFNKAIELNPKLSVLYANLGNVFLEEKDYPKAKNLYLKSISLGLNTYNVYHNLAKLYMAEHEYIDAQKMFDKAMSLNPTCPDLLFEYSIFCLRKKEYIKGFDFYRYRYDENKHDKQTYLISKNNLLKKSMDIRGKTLLLTSEQGFGDVIQFARYFPLFEQMGARVHVQAKELLFELLQKSYPNVHFLHENEMIEFDYHMPLLDSAYFFGTQYENIPFQNGYINIDRFDSKIIYDKYFQNDMKKRVGIVWRTNLVASESFSKQKERISRNISLEDFITFFNFGEIQLYSLQVNVTDEERQLLDKHKIPSLGDELVNFYDNALLIDNLDIVIGIDTVSVILAGAMGKDTIVLLSDYPDWRWTSDDSSTNWFRSIAIIRQDKKDDLQSELREALALLNMFVNKSPREVMMQKAIYYHQNGELAQAENLYRIILSEDPKNSTAYHFLGLIAYKMGNIEHAIGLISQALTLNPEDKEAYVNLETIIKNINESDFTKKYLNLKSEKFDIHKFSARGLNYKITSEEKRVLDEISADIDNLEKDFITKFVIKLYLEMIKGNFYEALKDYLQIKDNLSFDEHIKKLNFLNEIALKVKGFYLEKKEYELISDMFYKIFNNQNVDRKYQTQYIIIYHNFYMIDRNIVFQSSLQKVSEIFQNYLEIKLNVEALVILYDKITFMYWGLSHELDYLKICDEMIIKPFSKYLLEYFNTNKFEKREAISKKIKKRVCYLGSITSYQGAYAVGRVIYSVFKGHYELASDDFEFYYYAYGTVDEVFLQEIVDFGFKVRRFDGIDNLPIKLKTMRQSFFDDEIDIAISEMPWGIPTYLFESRIAPIQVYLDHGFAYWSIKNNDLQSVGLNSVELDKRHFYWGIGLDEHFITKKVDSVEFEKERKKYPKDCIILGSTQRLIKITEEYLSTILEILSANEKAIFICSGNGNDILIRKFIEKNNLEQRFYLPGFIDSHLYANIYDIYLDTFPFPSGLAFIEVMGYSKPLVHMICKGFDNHQNNKDPDLVVKNVDSYVKITNKLIQDKQFYLNKSQLSKKLADEMMDVKRSALCIEKSITKKILTMSQNNSHTDKKEDDLDLVR